MVHRQARSILCERAPDVRAHVSHYASVRSGGGISGRRAMLGGWARSMEAAVGASAREAGVAGDAGHSAMQVCPHAQSESAHSACAIMLVPSSGAEATDGAAG